MSLSVTYLVCKAKVSLWCFTDLPQCVDFTEFQMFCSKVTALLILLTTTAFHAPTDETAVGQRVCTFSDSSCKRRTHSRLCAIVYKNVHSYGYSSKYNYGGREGHGCITDQCNTVSVSNRKRFQPKCKLFRQGQVETENWNGTRKAESWNGKRKRKAVKAETEKLETGNARQN